MGLASVVHNGVQAPLKRDLGLLKICSNSSPIKNPKWVRVQFALRRPPHFYSAGCGRFRTYYSPITCSRGTEQEQESSTSDRGTSSSQPHNGGNDVESAHNSAVGNSAKNTGSPENYVTSIRTVALCVCTAVAFGVGLGLKDGFGKASEFFAGYLLEQSLSVDNLFVFVLVFKYFKVPIMYQNRVLSYGIAGAIVFRLSLILLGTATLQRFEAVNLFLAGILLYSSFKLFADEEEEDDLSNNFIVKTCQKFIPVTSNYDGNQFFTLQDGVWKV